jgi:hypothetical protein
MAYGEFLITLQLTGREGPGAAYRELHSLTLQTSVIISLFLCTIQVPYNEISPQIFPKETIFAPRSVLSIHLGSLCLFGMLKDPLLEVSE